jgi:hypothetical protein
MEEFVEGDSPRASREGDVVKGTLLLGYPRVSGNCRKQSECFEDRLEGKKVLEVVMVVSRKLLHNKLIRLY